MLNTACSHTWLLSCTHAQTRTRAHTAARMQKKKKKAAGSVTLTCGSTDAGAALPFCLGKQKKAMEGKERGGVVREGFSDGWMDGRMGGRREGGMRRDARRAGWRVVNERAEWLS